MDKAEQVKQFKQHYNVSLYQFAKTELSLKYRCKANDIAYIPPRPTDSVLATKARRKVLNRAIKTAYQGKRRTAMDDDDRFNANHQDVIRRRKRHLNEDKEKRQQRLHHEAELQRSQREQNLKKVCDQKEVKYTPPQSSNESIQT